MDDSPLAGVEEYAQNCHGGKLRVRLLLMDSKIYAELTARERSARGLALYAADMPLDVFAGLKLSSPEKIIPELLNNSYPQPRQVEREAGVFVSGKKLVQGRKVRDLQWAIRTEDGFVVIRATLNSRAEA